MLERMVYPMTLPLRGLASTLVVLALAMGPSTGCNDSSPVAAEGSSSEGGSTSSTSGPAMTTISSADTTAGSMSDSMASTAGTSSSSGDPDTTGTPGTTEGGASSSSDGTTSSGSTSSGGTTDPTSGTTDPSSGTTDLTGATTDPTGGTTDPTGGTTDPTGGTTDPTGGTTDPTGGTTDPTGGTTDPTGSSTGIDTDDIVVIPDFSGDFLMAVATPLDPTLPFQYIATFDFVPGGLGGGTVDIEMQPLALDTGSTTTPRTFFGPPLVFPGVPVTPDGTFAIPVGILSVAAECNPLFFIAAQANNVTFSAQVLDADDICGTVTGMLVFPVANPLDGTTFAAVRVADVLPASLPVAFPVACP
jgi:hypothetical protein